jgi:hypothetical protein
MSTVTATIQALPSNLEWKNTHELAFEQPKWKREPSSWKPLIHPHADEVSKENDDYFLQHWPFPEEKSTQAFLKAGFGKVTCLYFPLAKDDRILFACRLLTVLFLIDGTFSCPNDSRE